MKSLKPREQSKMERNSTKRLRIRLFITKVFMIIEPHCSPLQGRNWTYWQSKQKQIHAGNAN